MDQIKIGKFIAKCRKEKSLTQFQIAEMLGISDRAVSKWENGRSMPDSSVMLELCQLLGISVNDLLSGEKIAMENYDKELEKNLLEITKQKELADKRLLTLEIVIGFVSLSYFLVLIIIAALLPMADGLRILLILGAFIPFIIAMLFALKIEQVAGYYECQHCKHRYVPTYMSVNLAMHIGRTRYMKCPECHKWSWNKKVLKKED